jgi:putative FmdB family regulatory protein
VPNYDFKCNKCGSEREVFIYHKDYEKYIVRCDKCHAPMQKVWTATPTIFKTGGFYKTGG